MSPASYRAAPPRVDECNVTSMTRADANRLTPPPLVTVLITRKGASTGPGRSRPHPWGALGRTPDQPSSHTTPRRPPSPERALPPNHPASVPRRPPRQASLSPGANASRPPHQPTTTTAHPRTGTNRSASHPAHAGTHLPAEPPAAAPSCRPALDERQPPSPSASHNRRSPQDRHQPVASHPTHTNQPAGHPTSRRPPSPEHAFPPSHPAALPRRPPLQAVSAPGRTPSAPQAAVPPYADSSCRSASRSRAARSATDPGPRDTARSAHRCPSASSPRRA